VPHILLAAYASPCPSALDAAYKGAPPMSDFQNIIPSSSFTSSSAFDYLRVLLWIFWMLLRSMQKQQIIFT
jgi:hypothetical protein